MKILVTGSSGLVGRYVSDGLSQTHDVEMLDVKPPHRTDLPFHQVNMLDGKAVKAVVKCFDAVVHLAGIPHPLNHSGEEVFRTNTLGTYNFLEACAENNIPKFVFISSESTLGFAFAPQRLIPNYLPLDEDHPLLAQDPYGLSKLTGELLCKGFSQRSGLKTICLRPPWIWVPQTQEIAFYKELIRAYPKWQKNVWAYIHVLDVVQAIQATLEANNLPNHDAYFITADSNWTGQNLTTLAREFYPEVTDFRADKNGDISLITCQKAKRAFGFQPKYSWKDIAND